MTKLQKLEQLVLTKFRPDHLNKDVTWSEGNYDDVFSDGQDQGTASILEHIKAILESEEYV